MRTMQGLPLLLIFCLTITFSFGFRAIAWGGQSESIGQDKLSINGYEGELQKMEIPAAIQAIEELKIGDPPFMKDPGGPEAYGLKSCQGGALQKGTALVHVFKLQFKSEDQVASILNLKCKPSTNRPPLSAENPTNCRNPYFGLFSMGPIGPDSERRKRP